MFQDRVDAGRRLGELMSARSDTFGVVLALPSGGVPVGVEVARLLGLPLDVILVRKLGVPGRPELAFGAIGEGDIRGLDQNILRWAQVTEAQVASVDKRERIKLQLNLQRYRAVRRQEPIAGRDVLVVDDGAATGSTARAAALVARARGASRIVLAFPVASAGALQVLSDVADEVVALDVPRHFGSVGQWFADFRPTAAAEVDEMLAAAARPVTKRPAS